MKGLTKPKIVANRLRATRERSVRTCALALLGTLVGCAAAPTLRQQTAVQDETAPRVEPEQRESLVLEWPRATPRDVELAREVVSLTRDALLHLVPELRPLGDVPVRIVVTDAPQQVGSGYYVPLREVRIERRYLDRTNLAHETAHALLHGRLGDPPPLWLDEAIAQLAQYRVVHGKDLAPPPGRPVSDFAAVRALRGEAWAAAGGHAYGESARWLGYLLPSGPASAAEKAAFARFVTRLANGDTPDVAERELGAVDVAVRR